MSPWPPAALAARNRSTCWMLLFRNTSSASATATRLARSVVTQLAASPSRRRQPSFQWSCRTLSRHRRQPGRAPPAAQSRCRRQVRINRSCGSNLRPANCFGRGPAAPTKTRPRSITTCKRGLSSPPAAMASRWNHPDSHSATTAVCNATSFFRPSTWPPTSGSTSGSPSTARPITATPPKRSQTFQRSLARPICPSSRCNQATRSTWSHPACDCR